MTADSFYTVLASFCCYSEILVEESEKLHTVVSKVKLHWHLGLFNFIMRQGLCKLNPLSMWSAATANFKMVYCELEDIEVGNKPKRGKKITRNILTIIIAVSILESQKT